MLQDSITLIVEEEVRHFTAIQEVDDVLYEALFLDLDVRKQEDTLVALRTNCKAKLLQVFLKLYCLRRTALNISLQSGI